MSSKATYVAPSNIALVKYWGARDLERVVPENPSISMTLRACVSRTTVEHDRGAGEAGADGDEILWRPDEDGRSLEVAPPGFSRRVHHHLDHLRRRFGVGGRFRVATVNSFPAAAGIASSASGFAALTLAVAAALGRSLADGALDAVTASILTRESGSGSATRSVLGGYVQWPSEWPLAESEDGVADGGCAVQIAPADHWDLRDLVVIVEDGPKETSSLDGHRVARTSPYFKERLLHLPRRLQAVRRAIEARDFAALGPEVEAEAIDLHCIAMTSAPPIYYWRPATLEVLAAVRSLRADGVPAFSTLDAGANVHVLCEPAHEEAVAERLGALRSVRRILRDRVGDGPSPSDRHLF